MNPFKNLKQLQYQIVLLKNVRGIKISLDKVVFNLQ